MKKRISAMFLTLCMALLLFPASALAVEVASGTSDDNITWTLDDAGTLTISGTGEIVYTPWHSFSDSIKVVHIENGVTKIGNDAFTHCNNLTSVTIPNSVTTIESCVFNSCSSLTSVTIPDRVTIIEQSTFQGCTSLTSITIPDRVTAIKTHAFAGCTGLTSVAIPDSVIGIWWKAFDDCDNLSDVYYSGTKEQWQAITIDKSSNAPLRSATIHYNSTLPGNAGTVKPEVPSTGEYLYDTTDAGENTQLPVKTLENVSDSVSAVDAVKQMTTGMTSEQKVSATGVDLATLYAETAAAKAASKEVEGDVIISAASTADLAAEAAQAVSAVETALVNGGVTTARYLANTVTLTTDETGEITIKIDPDILTTDVDKIRVETPSYALTLKIADLAEDLTEVLTITAHEVGETRTQGVGAGFLPGAVNRKVSVRINLPKGRLTNPVTVSLPTGSGATTYQAVVQSDGTATSSKYNPVTTSIDGKVNTSGTYTVQTNEKSFTDISNKSAEMQKAILYLTSKGIINGTSATEFSPDGTINRQQIAALIMRALGKVDSTATATFTDVSKSSSLYRAIASSQKHKVINGYSDNTFRGANIISRAQIVTVAGRVLTTEMNYKTPANMNTYLSKYSDAVPEFAQEMVALATRENLVVYRTDGTFSGAKNMTRGDAAIILYRLFQRIW